MTLFFFLRFLNRITHARTRLSDCVCVYDLAPGLGTLRSDFGVTNSKVTLSRGLSPQYHKRFVVHSRDDTLDTVSTRLARTHTFVNDSSNKQREKDAAEKKRM